MRDTPWNHALQDAVDDGTVPGAVTLVARGDEVHLESVGVMALGGPPMPTDAIVRIQSMTKAITSVATLLAVQGGRQTLDAPVQTWLPELVDRVVLRDLVQRAEEVLAPIAHALAVTQLTRIEVGSDGAVSGSGVMVGPHFTVVSEESEDGSVIGYRSVDEAGLRAVLEVLLRPGAGPLAAGQDG